MPKKRLTYTPYAKPSPCDNCVDERTAVCHTGCKKYKIYKLMKMLDRAKTMKRRARALWVNT